MNLGVYKMFIKLPSRTVRDQLTRLYTGKILDVVDLETGKHYLNIDEDIVLDFNNNTNRAKLVEAKRLNIGNLSNTLSGVL